MAKNFLNTVFYKSAHLMDEIPDNTVDLIVTSPPYFNIKSYFKDGYQENDHSDAHLSDLGNIGQYDGYIDGLLKVWKECQRTLKPNGKLAINTPLMPMKKADYSPHYNRHIFDINSDIQHSILRNTKFHLLDLYIWNRTNPTKKLMFGSYPYPRNFYAQNTTEFIAIYVKDGIPVTKVAAEIKERSKLTEKEWVEYTQQIWNIPIPNKSDKAFGKHTAIMPEEIPKRCIRLFTFENDIVLDPFAGSGTTLKVAKQLNRNYIGYELYENYREIIESKLNQV
jgi:site-specific DNA-methyltransferase (cytosine-N4-specific)